MKTNKTAPIALFVYNRPSHTRRTLKALERADLSSLTDVFVLADGAKNADAIPLVNEVRSIIGEPWGFKSLNIMERDKNWGLAANIIDGVSLIIQQYGQIIVFEDDLEVAPHGLRYFNDALERYSNAADVMHISGYMYPLKDAKKLPESFFFRVPSSWGWATWSRAWKHFNPNIDELTKEFTKNDIKRFSIDYTENFWKQVSEFKSGKINSWAIRWYLSIFKNNGLALYPRHSMIQNTGNDGSGTHSDDVKMYQTNLAEQKIQYFPESIIENKEAYEAIKYFYKHRKGDLFFRVIRFLRKKWKKI